MKYVILDTNFVLAPFTLNIDIYAQISTTCAFAHKLVVFEGVFDELAQIHSQGGQAGMAAKASTQLLIQKRDLEEISVLPGRGHVDDLIVNYVNQNPDNIECIVATQDKELKKRLKCQILSIRQKQFVQLTN